MRAARLLLSFVLSALFLMPSAAQQPTAPNAQAIALLQRAHAVLSGGQTLSHVTLSGPARRTAGSDDDTGTAVFKALASGAGRTDLSLSSGQHSELCDLSATAPAGSWSGPDRVSHAIAFHNLLTEPAWFFPAFAIARRLSAIGYPSAKVVTYTVSNAQRLTAAKDVANNVQFATAASYVPPGGLSALVTGQISGGFSGINESHNYNSSLEYTSTKATSTTGTAMDLSLSYNLSGGDNGTVTGITNNADTLRTQSFTYDPLNRILSAQSSATSGTDCWGQVFGPDGNAADDAVANLTRINSGTQAQPPCQFGMLNATVDANNHINTDSTFAYDAAGNMTKDGGGTGYLYTFDDEGHLTLAAGPAGGPYCYVYDGNGLRVAKKSSATTCSSGTVTKLYWRSITGDAIAETDSSGSTTNSAYNEYVFFGGRRIASRNGTGSIFYWFADQIGSTRTITTGSGPGQTPGQLCYDADFTPYGQEISHTERLQTTACPPNYKFTGYERDTETGFDYAFARYYSPRLGRFLSTDPLGGSVGDLQSHNAYSYVENNPLNSIDPSGLGPCGLNASMFAIPANFPCDKLAGLPNLPITSFWHGWNPLQLWLLSIAFTPTVVGLETVNVYDDHGNLISSTSSDILSYQSLSLADAAVASGGNNSGGFFSQTKTGCFIKGAAIGAATAVGVGLVAAGAVALGVVSAPVASGALLLAGGIGGAVALYNGITQAGNGNWAGAAYSAGTIAGGVAGGSVVGATVGDAINPGATRGFSLVRDWGNRFKPSLGRNVGKWLGTGPDAQNAAAASGLAGAGAATAAKGGC